MPFSNISAVVTDTFDSRNNRSDRSIDFLIDGTSLRHQLGAPARNMVAALSTRWVGNELAAKKMRMIQPSGLVDDRVEIFVCPLCGDIGCGSITVKVEQTPNGFRWSDFAEENDYDPSMTDRDSYRLVGPFEFNKTDYLAAIDSALALVPT